MTPLPMVSSADVDADLQFFADYPSRHYRIGRNWVIRRRGRGVFLRAPLPPDHRHVDTEAGAERLWWLTAWPDLDPLVRAAMAKAARRKGR
jgi:hypothetical protein